VGGLLSFYRREAALIWAGSSFSDTAGGALLEDIHEGMEQLICLELASERTTIMNAIDDELAVDNSKKGLDEPLPAQRVSLEMSGNQVKKPVDLLARKLAFDRDRVSQALWVAGPFRAESGRART
jgi:hypothetical protein